MSAAPASGPPGAAGALDFFGLEAADCVARIERWAQAAERDPGAPADDARPAARALRGAATVARQPEFAAVGAALERALGGAHAAHAVDAVIAAVDAVRSALRSPRPLPPAEADRLRSAADGLDEAVRYATEATGAPAGGAPAAALPAAPSASAERVVAVRTLAADGDAGWLVHRAPSPPTTADRRFRLASVPLAEAVRQLVADARAAGAGNADRHALAETLGADLRAALADLRELAESYDVAPAARFFAGRETAAAALEPAALAAVDAAAAGLVAGRPLDGAPASDPLPEVPPEPAGAEPLDPVLELEPEPEPAALAPAAGAARADDAFRPPTGEALVALLETGISSFGGLDALQAEAAPPAAVDAAGPDAVVPIESLLYAGRAALERARAVRDELRARPGPPDPALLAELYDLLDLAAT